jgi:hypothetical protein
MRLLAGAGGANTAARRSPSLPVGAGQRWGLAGRDPGRSARAAGPRPSTRGPSCTPRCAVSAVGVRWLHLLSHPRPRRLPRRRHGPRQDHPGDLPAAGAPPERAARPEPARGPRLPHRQLDRRARPRFAPSLRYLVAHPSALPAADLKARPPKRPGRAPIWSSPATARCCAPPGSPHRVGPRDPRRGAGDQEPRHPPDARGEAAHRPRAHRPDRHPGGEPPRRPVVLFDFINPGLLGTAKEFTAWIRRRRSDAPTAAYGPAAPSWSAPTSSAASRPTAAVIADLPDKTELRVLYAERRRSPSTSRRSTTSPRRSTRPTAEGVARGAGAGLPHALQADLQPPLAVARRRRAGPRPTAASWPACASWPRSSPPSRRRCWCSPVSRLTDPLAAFLWVRSSGARPACCTAPPR